MSPKVMRRHAVSVMAAFVATVALFMLPLLMSGLHAMPQAPSEYGSISLASTPAPSRDSESDARETPDSAEPEPMQDFAPPDPGRKLYSATAHGPAGPA